MCLGFQGNHTLDVFHLEIVGFGVVCRGKLLNHRTFGKSYIVFVGGNDFIGIFLCSLFNHLEEGRLLFHSVNDECSTKDFVTAMLGIDLSKTEYFGVCQRTSQVLFYFLEIFHLLFGQGQALFFVIGFKVLDVNDGFRLTIGCKYMLVQSLVHTLQHRVVVCILVFYGEIFLDTDDAVQTHVLGDFHGVSTPRSNHFTARADEMSFQVVFTFGGGFSKKPTEFVAVCLGKFVVTLYGNHALGWGSEKKNHTYIYDLTIYDLAIEVTNS